MDQTIEKLLANGTRISAEAHEIVRIPGLLTDADMIGARRLERLCTLGVVGLEGRS